MGTLLTQISLILSTSFCRNVNIFNFIMQLRSLALPFTVLEWTLPTVPRPAQNKPSRTSSFLSKDRGGMSPTGTSSPTKASSADASEQFLLLKLLSHIDFKFASFP